LVIILGGVSFGGTRSTSCRNYDRTNKFDAADTKAIFNANQAIIKSAAALQ